MSESSSPNREEIKKQLVNAKSELNILKKQKSLLQSIYNNLAAPENDFHSGVVKAIPKIDDDLSWRGDTRRSFDKNLDFIQSTFSSMEKNTIIPIRRAIYANMREVSEKISKLERKVNKLTFSLNNPLFPF